MMEVFDEFFARATCANVGSRLWKLMADAGFEAPDCRVEYPMSGGAESVFYEWFAESFRSIRPRVVALGIIGESDLDPDTLEQRLRDEATASNSGIAAPAMIAAFARLRSV